MKRRYRRFRVSNREIFTRALFDLEAELLNISAGGACVKTEQSLKSAAGQMVKLQTFKSPLALPCAVVWEDRMDNPDEVPEKNALSFKTGISFMGLLPDKLVDLHNFIGESLPSEHRAGDAHRPGLVRFQVHTNRKAIMYYAETLPVRKIGLGGFLAELHRDIQPGKIFPMDLFIPNESHPIRFHGRVASSIPTPERGPGCFDIGIEFLDIDVIDNFRLSKFLLLDRIPCE